MNQITKFSVSLCFLLGACTTPPSTSSVAPAERQPAASYDFSCLDARATTFETCPEKTTRFYVQGHCSARGQFEQSYCAVKGKPDCLEIETTFVPPCPSEQTRKFHQGQCAKASMFEFTYCSRRSRPVAKGPSLEQPI